MLEYELQVLYRLLEGGREVGLQVTAYFLGLDIDQGQGLSSLYKQNIICGVEAPQVLEFEVE